MSIEGKIAAVISEYEVALNVGEEAGVRVGDLATLYRVIEVKDPDTTEVLGVVRRPAIRFEIVEVQTKACVGQTFEPVPTEPGEALTTFLGVGGRRRVTGSPTAEDRRTMYVQTGSPVTIVRPRKKAEETG